METPDNNFALLLSGRADKFRKTKHRILSELNRDFGGVHIYSATWKDQFVNINPQFNNDVDYVRSTIEVADTSFVAFNSQFHNLVSNHEMLDDFIDFQTKFDTELNLIQFIKYYAPTMLVIKVFELFYDTVNDRNLKYKYVMRSRFDLLFQDFATPEVIDWNTEEHKNLLYTKNVEPTHADQDSYLGTQETFLNVTGNFKKVALSTLEIFYRDVLLQNVPADDIRLWPESIFKNIMTGIGVELKNRYPYSHTGIYRNELDDYGHVRDIRKRNLSENLKFSWK